MQKYKITYKVFLLPLLRRKTGFIKSKDISYKDVSLFLS